MKREDSPAAVWNSEGGLLPHPPKEGVVWQEKGNGAGYTKTTDPLLNLNAPPLACVSKMLVNDPL